VMVISTSTFISLSSAGMGGAIYSLAAITIIGCKFVNNSAGDNQGNDVFVCVESDFYKNGANLEGDCSWSVSPWKFLLCDGV
jgi:hypothetical protein